jgi:hypothetical protein
MFDEIIKLDKLATNIQIFSECIFSLAHHKNKPSPSAADSFTKKLC